MVATSDSEQARARRAESAVDGATIFLVAGSVWMGLALYSLWGLPTTAPWRVGPGAAVGLAGLLLLVAITRARHRLRVARPHAPPPTERDAWAQKRFITVNVAQGIAIFVAVQVWANLHRPEYLWPTVSAIVGLHFFALDPVFESRHHKPIGPLMCLFGAAVLALPKTSSAGVPIRPLALGLGNGLLLWGNSLLRLASLRADRVPAG